MEDYLGIRQASVWKEPREVLLLQDKLKKYTSLPPPPPGPLIPSPLHPCVPILEQWKALNDLNALVHFKSEKQVTKPSGKFPWATDSSLFVLVNKMFKIGLDLLSL